MAVDAASQSTFLEFRRFLHYPVTSRSLWGFDSHNLPTKLRGCVLLTTKFASDRDERAKSQSTFATTMKFTALIAAAVLATTGVLAAETPALRALADATAEDTASDEMNMQPDTEALNEEDDDGQQERRWGGGGGKWGGGGGKWGGGGGKWGRGW